MIPTTNRGTPQNVGPLQQHLLSKLLTNKLLVRNLMNRNSLNNYILIKNIKMYVVIQNGEKYKK